jgi:alpha-2-macroglobulin
MIRIPILRFLKVFGIIFFASIVFSCKMKRKIIHINPAFSKYIEAFTSGVISKKNTIQLQLSSDLNTVHTLYQALDEHLFSFSPSIPGKAYWIDNRTIEFKPEKDLKTDALYEVSFHLNKIVSVPDAFKTFTFNIQTQKPSFQVSQNGLYATGKETMMLKGQVTTADVEESKSIESMLSALKILKGRRKKKF